MKTRRRHKKQKGGQPRLVGQGAYGCGFSPSLRCNTNVNHSPDVFSKLMRKNLSADELVSAQRIKEIDPTFQFSVYPYKSCSIKNENIRNQRAEINKCRATHKMNNALIKRNYTLLQSPMGGNTLEEVIIRISRNLPGDFNNFTEPIITTFSSISNLFDGLAKMHASNYYHMDIKPNNIVISNVNGKIAARFIDFGLSIDGRKEASQISNVYRRSYFLWPFELRFFKNLPHILEYGDYAMNEQIDSYYHDVVNENIRYNQTSRSQYYDGTRQILTPQYATYIFTQMINNSKEHDFLFEMSDVYSMGLLLYYLLNKFTGTYYDSDTVFYKTTDFIVRLDDRYLNSIANIQIIRNFMTVFGNDLYRLAYRMLSINPLERPTSAEAGRIYKTLLANLEKNRHTLVELPKTPPRGIVNTVKNALRRKNATLSPSAYKLPPGWSIETN